MKIWQFQEMYNKVIVDLDLQDETFIAPSEMVGYFNEALTEAGSEIESLNKDYFLTKYSVPLVTGTRTFPLPYNIFANKIRGIVYANGSIIYPVVRYRRENQFVDMAFTDQYGAADDYRYLLINNSSGQALLDLRPVARETAILSPVGSTFLPMTMWYIRDVSRIPLLGELCNLELLQTTQVNVATSVLTVNAGTTTIGRPTSWVAGGYPGSIPYVTGDQVQFQPGPAGTLPSPLVAGTTYFVIAVTPTTIKLATTLANASAGTSITLTTTGTVLFTMQVVATQAIINASLIDIPEFATFVMQWVKCRCMEKEGDPRLDGASSMLAQQKKQMVDSLTNNIPDDVDTIFPDFSSYEEMS